MNGKLKHFLICLCFLALAQESRRSGSSPIPGNLMVYSETGFQIVSIMSESTIHQDEKLHKTNPAKDTNIWRFNFIHRESMNINRLFNTKKPAPNGSRFSLPYRNQNLGG